MAGLSITGQLKVSTLQDNFLKEFGLTLRIYDGRSFADPSQTLAQARKHKGSGNGLSVAKNMKVGSLERKFEVEFGLKVQVAGSDDSYLCNDDFTLNAAQLEDEKKLSRKTKKALRQEDEDSAVDGDDKGLEIGADITNLSKKDETLKAVKEGSLDLFEASEELKADKDVVKAAIDRAGGNVFEDADGILKADREFVLLMAKTAGKVLNYVHDTLKTDRDIVLAAVSSMGRALQWADPSLRADREIVLAALNNNRDAFEFVDEKLQPEFEEEFGGTDEDDLDESNLLGTMEFDSDEEAEAYLKENLDDDWDEGFDYGDDEAQETSKDLNTLAADVIKKGEALYAKLSTEQIDVIKENLENDNASGYSEVADEVEDQELSDQLRMLGLEVYSCQNNRSPMYDDVSSYIDDMEDSHDTLHSSELKLSSMKILLEMALVHYQGGFFADDFVRDVFGRLDDYDAASSRSFTKCAIDALISNALDSKECAACYCTASTLARRFRDSDDNIDFDINVIKELFSSAIDKCKTTEDFLFARGAIRNAFLDPDLEGALLSRIPDDL